MFGDRDRVLPIWPLLKDSPVVQLFGWSTLAHQAFETNRDLFSPASRFQEHDEWHLDGLLALHLRRGDFLEHCKNLCRWSADFNAFNRFPEFVDPWERPEGPDHHRMDVYLRRCVPTVEQIVEKVGEIRASHAGQGLRNIYIMTNGDVQWLDELKKALRQVHAWEHIATSRDMVFTWEEKFVSQSMDMMIGERAQVFVGNGVSDPFQEYIQLKVDSCIVLESVVERRDASYGEVASSR